jgi:hypothetical protein
MPPEAEQKIAILAGRAAPASVALEGMIRIATMSGKGHDVIFLPPRPDSIAGSGMSRWPQLAEP